MAARHGAAVSRRDKPGYSTISPQEYEKLLQKAVRVDPSRAETPDHPECVRRLVTRPVKTTIEIPVEETVKVPMTKQVAHHSTMKKIVKGKELVPVQKFQEVQETHIEVKEELVKGVRTVWKKVEEPYEKIVKRPVPVTKTVRVPYTDYEEKEVEMVVEVPCDTMEEKEGYRMDTTLKMQPVEVEQDEVYELIPHFVSRGEVKIKPGDHAQDLGCVSIGRECFPSDQLHHHRSGQKSSPKTPIVSKDENHHHSRHRRAIDEYHQHVAGEHGERRQRPQSVSGTRAALIQGMDREALIQRLKSGGAPKAPTSARRVEYPSNSARPTSAPGSATGARRIARYERYERQQQQREQQLLLPGDPPHGAGLLEKRGPRVAVHRA